MPIATDAVSKTKHTGAVVVAQIDPGNVVNWKIADGTFVPPDAATAPFNCATTGGLISATGVAGLTLRGDTGRLRGRRGLSRDNLLPADLVTTDGQLVQASKVEDTDLLWAPPPALAEQQERTAWQE